MGHSQGECRSVLWRLIKLLLFLVVLGGLGLIAYAYIGPIFFPQDFAAPEVRIEEPVILETE